MKNLILTTKRVAAIVICCLCVTATYSQEYRCSDDDHGRLLANTSDCHTFYQCANGYWHLLECQGDLLFDSQKLYCDWPENVDCASYGTWDAIGNFFSGQGRTRDEYARIEHCTKNSTYNSGGYNFGVNITIPVKGVPVGISVGYTSPSSGYKSSSEGIIRHCENGGLDNCSGTNDCI